MVLEFEKPIADLSKNSKNWKVGQKGRNIDLSSEFDSLEEKILCLEERKLFKTWLAWSEGSFPRHADRPYALQIISNEISTDFVEFAWWSKRERW